MARGQSATEFLILFGAFLVILVGFAAVATSFVADAGLQSSVREASESVQALARAADSVAAQGGGASVTVLVSIPQNTVFGPNYTYVGRPQNAPSSVGANRININSGGTDIFATTRMPLTGFLPSSPGKRVLRVVSHGTYVSIGTGLADVSPSEIIVRMSPNSTAWGALNITFPGEYPSAVNLTSDWPYQSPNMTIGPPSAVSGFNNTTVTIPLNFTSNTTAKGIYSATIFVRATTNGTDYQQVENTQVPVTAEVG